MATRKAPTPSPSLPLIPPFELRKFLDSAGIKRTITKFARSSVVFAQGDPAIDVFYIQLGSVKLSVLSRTGKEQVVAILAQGFLFGQDCRHGNRGRSAAESD